MACVVAQHAQIAFAAHVAQEGSPRLQPIAVPAYVGSHDHGEHAGDPYFDPTGAVPGIAPPHPSMHNSGDD
jgi:hypothetical protein